MSQPVCLIAEDDCAISIALEDEIAAAGFSVLGPFSSCASALKALTAGRADVAVLDTMLSDGACIALAAELKKRSVPFAVFSGRNQKDEHAPDSPVRLGLQNLRGSRN